MKLHYVRTTALSLVFGIGWAVGLAKHGTEGVTGVILDVLFLLTIGLLGVVLFLSSCVASSSVRSVWQEYLHKQSDTKQETPSNISMSRQTQKSVLQFKEPVELQCTVSITSEEIVFNPSTLDENTDLPVAKSPPPDSDEIHPKLDADVSVLKSLPIDSTEIDLPDPNEETQL